MKLSFISKNAYPVFVTRDSSVFGGSEIQMYRAAEYLADKGHVVSVIVGDFGQKEQVVDKKIRLYKGWWRERKSPSLVNVLSIFKFLAVCLADKSDVYIIRGASMELGLLRLLKTVLGKELVFMVASNTDLDISFNQGLWTRKMYQWGLLGVDLVVCQNRFQLRQQQLKNEVVIGNWHSIPEEIPKKKKTKNISWVGTSQTLKRPELVVKLAKEIPGIKIKMVLSAHDSRVYQRTKRLAKGVKNLEMYPRMSPEQAENVIKNSDILINTSLYEGVPNTFIEAAKWGVPIVSLKVDLGGKILDRSGGGVSCGDNWATFKKEVVDLLTDDKRLKKMGRAAYRWAKDNFDIESNMAKLEKLLTQLVEPS